MFLNLEAYVEQGQLKQELFKDNWDRLGGIKEDAGICPTQGVSPILVPVEEDAL